MKFSVQLYSLRDMIKNADDLLAIFPKLKAMGFDGVEFAGYHDLDAATIRKALDDAGLVATGAHIGLENYIPENLQATLDFHKTLGMTTVGMGGAPHGDPEETKETCAIIAEAYKVAKEQGMTVYFHNHASEFDPFDDGTLAIDFFLEACELQLDTFWSFIADIDNYTFITENKDRICHLHIKDGDGPRGTALGEGEVDLHEVVRAAHAIGLEWLVLEDETRGAGMESVAKGIVWLKENAC
jgi:sugar phosphate isomerase/epimerase